MSDREGNGKTKQERSRSRSRSPKRNRSERTSRAVPGSNRVIVKNIPYEVKWQELKDKFREELGDDVLFVRMLETPEGRPRGVAMVEFTSPEQAKKAIDNFNQRKMNDRHIIVKEEREKDRQEFMAQESMRQGDRGGGPPVGMGGPNMGPGGGMNSGLPGWVSPQLLQQLGIEGPITSTVFVANLDYRVTWLKLKDVFKLAGNVMHTEIKEDKNGKSRGMGIVQFEVPMEAVQAVSMFNGQVLYDRNMIVRIDKGVEPEKPKLPSGLKSIGMGLGSGGAPVTNFSQMGSNGSYGMSDPYMKQDLGFSPGSGLLGGFGGGGASGLGLLGSGGMGGGADFAGLGGLGGLGLGGAGSMNSGAGSGSLGLGSGMSDLGLGLGSSKLGMQDNFPTSYAGSGFTNSANLSGLGGLGPNLNSLSGGLGGSGDRFGMSQLDRIGLDSLGRDRMALERMGSSLGDRMAAMDRMGMGGMDKGRDNYGSGRDMRDMRDDRRRTTMPNNCTLIVTNLPYSTTWKELKEHFRDAGDVKYAEIVMDKDKGRSSGTGYVRFSNESDAFRAIGMKNRSRLDRRNIDVGFFRG